MTYGKKFRSHEGVVYCVRRHLAWLQRHVRRFLIVFIFTSGVGNGLLKPVHRLCSVSAEIVSNAPDVPSVETMEALPNFDSGTQQETFHGISNGSLSAQSITVNTPKSRDAIARRASNEEGGVVSSTAIDNGAQRTSAQLNKQGEKVTYGERLRRLSSQGNRDENGEADGSYKTRNGFFQTDKVKSEAVYPTEAVEHRHKNEGVPKDNLSPASLEPPDKNSRATSGTRTALKKSVSLRSDEEVSTEGGRSKVADNGAQVEVSDEKTRTETAHISEAESKAKEDALRYETRQALLKDVRATWAVQSTPKSSATSEGVSPKIPLPQPETLQQYAKRVILPQIHIDRVPLAETLKVISDVIRTHTTNERTVNFILADPKKTAPEVDLDIRDVSLERVLHYLSEMTQFTVLYEGNTVIFRDPSLKQTLRTCMFPISRGSVLQILSYTDLHNSDEEKKLSEEER